jgi:hypothetical protein
MILADGSCIQGPVAPNFATWALLDIFYIAAMSTNNQEILSENTK